ncbi:hypothetical protein F5Y10DRAFT_57451 [Nemania abortiva]|nr:hypothetical protein F5Y10DRAFT_57451 [Nemania abortiva]
MDMIESSPHDEQVNSDGKDIRGFGYGVAYGDWVPSFEHHTTDPSASNPLVFDHPMFDPLDPSITDLSTAGPDPATAQTPAPANHQLDVVLSESAMVVNSFAQANELPASNSELLKGSPCVSPHAADGSHPTPLNMWTEEQDTFFLAERRKGYSLQTISEAMKANFGVTRTPNMLSKRYAVIRSRSLDSTVYNQVVTNVLPTVLGAIDEEMRKFDPDCESKEEYKKFRADVPKRLLGLVHRLAGY